MSKIRIFVVIMGWAMKSLTSAVRTILGPSNGCGVVFRTGLAFGFSFFILIKSNVTVVAGVGSVVAVSSGRTVY